MEYNIKPEVFWNSTHEPGGSARARIFRLIDLQGRVVQGFDADKNDTTYLVPLEKYASGIYFLQYAEKGIPVNTQQVIIQK